MGTLNPEPLDVMASVIEPVSFHGRYQGQKTDSLTALDRLVDAVVADPPSRLAITHEVNAVVDPAYVADRAAAEIALRQRFMQWHQAAPLLEAWAHRSVRLSDIDTRAQQLGNLGRVGLEALSFVDAHATPPSGWQESRIALISEAEKPSALVRFVSCRISASWWKRPPKAARQNSIARGTSLFRLPPVQFPMISGGFQSRDC
jgi:hexosaminidase